MSKPAIPKTSFDDLYRAIGELCIAWASLDSNLTNLASILIARGPEVTACVFTGSKSITPRSEAIKKLLIVEPPSPENEWQKKLIAIVVDIQNRISPLRNRFIHDQWLIGMEDIVRIQWVGHVYKGPSGVPEFRTAKRQSLTVTEITSLVDDVWTTSNLLHLAVSEIAISRRSGRPPEPFWL